MDLENVLLLGCQLLLEGCICGGHFGGRNIHLRLEIHTAHVIAEPRTERNPRHERLPGMFFILIPLEGGRGGTLLGRCAAELFAIHLQNKIGDGVVCAGAIENCELGVHFRCNGTVDVGRIQARPHAKGGHGEELAPFLHGRVGCRKELPFFLVDRIGRAFGALYTTTEVHPDIPRDLRGGNIVQQHAQFDPFLVVLGSHIGVQAFIDKTVGQLDIFGCKLRANREAAELNHVRCG